MAPLAQARPNASMLSPTRIRAIVDTSPVGQLTAAKAEPPVPPIAVRLVVVPTASEEPDVAADASKGAHLSAIWSTRSPECPEKPTTA